MRGDAIVSLIAVAMALVLAWRALATRRLPPQRILVIALAWLVIIGVLAVIITSLGR
ncbi:MAG: hypothetical protein JF593_06395 [Novosphingobium sp.]|nr:hypothetical protein [Novosphingobium sp.]